jgi:hypothetical protein
MNERIRELLLQATTLRGPPFIRFKVDQEKFAELIVRECAEVGSFGHGPTDSGLIKREVLEHFGFEE